MQLSRILLALMLSIAPLGARGQEPTQPVSLEEPCSVSADPSWTSQEKFVWEHVCVGEDADFNAAPDYGGHLDPTKPDDWAQDRVLRPKFLEMILFKDPYRSALTRKGVVIAGARFTEAIDLDNAELEHPFELIGSLFEKDVKLRRVRSKFPIMLEGSNVAGFLDMNELELSGDLLIYFDHFYNVNLTAAHVGGQIDLTNSKVSGPLTMDGLQVGGLTMLGTESAEVELMGAHVSGALKLAGSKVGTVNCYGLEVEQQVWMAAESNNLVDCRIAKIKGDLYLGGQFTRDVDLSGAEIDGSLHFESARWDDYVTLVLRDAKVLGTIPGLADAWAPKLDLDGFTYRSVSEADQFKGWLGRLPNYVRQPYDQLASIVQSQGNSELATAIRYSSRDRERSEATGGGWLWLTILKWVIGYGYYPYMAIFWAIALVIMGALVLRVSGEGPRNKMPYGLSYSFDILLPIIRLREKHYQIDLKSWPRYYFYGHKIMGYVLASFLIAGLAGLTK